MKRLVGLLVLVSLMVVLVPVGGAKAADQSITVTATGEYLSFTFTGGNWTLASGGSIAVNDWFYSNPLGELTIPSDPVVDGECTHTVTNTGNVHIDVTVKWADMEPVGAGDHWINSDAGTNGDMTFGAYACLSGDDWSTEKVLAKNAAAYETLITGLADTDDIKVVFGFFSPTIFDDGLARDGDITLTATETP